MKVIDLLNKIANGEEVPKKIYCFDREFYWKENTYFGDTFIFMHYIQEEDLNEKVEIIEDTPKEDKKINRVERKARNLTNQYIKDKLNEIIDKLNGE
jgi:hypothetical protein